MEYDFSTYGERVPEGIKSRYSWISGQPFGVDMPDPILYEQDKPGPLEDFLYTSMSQFLVSRRLFDVVRSMSTCARGYPAQIFYEGELLSDDYFAVNFEESWSCMDLKKSKFKKSKIHGHIHRVTRLVLCEDRIPRTEQIFRLRDFSVFLIASRAFKDAVENECMSGIGFFDFRGKYLV
jgi:hypothetical protein